MKGASFAYEVKVPKERVAVIIGAKGAVKQALQEDARVHMDVDSREGVVTLSGGDGLALYTAREVVKAIARGFNPDVAQLLLRPDYTLEQIKLADYAGTKEAMQRLKGRVIGLKGKSRARIEELTESFVSVYGKTVCIIGEHGHASIAKRAVEKLLGGSMHATVWKFLEKMKRELKAREFAS